MRDGRLRELRLFRLEKKRLGDLTSTCQYLSRGAGKIEPDSSQLCPGKGQEETGKACDIGSPTEA